MWSTPWSYRPIFARANKRCLWRCPFAAPMCIKKQYTQSESSKNTFEHNNVQEGPYGRIMTVHVWDSAQRTFKKIMTWCHAIGQTSSAKDTNSHEAMHKWCASSHLGIWVPSCTLLWLGPNRRRSFMQRRTWYFIVVDWCKQSGAVKTWHPC